MKLPRDLSGNEVAKLLAHHYGYRVARTKGSHMMLTLTVAGNRHTVTVPRHRNRDVGRHHRQRRSIPRSLQA